MAVEEVMITLTSKSLVKSGWRNLKRITKQWLGYICCVVEKTPEQCIELYCADCKTMKTGYMESRVHDVQSRTLSSPVVLWTVDGMKRFYVLGLLDWVIKKLAMLWIMPSLALLLHIVLSIITCSYVIRPEKFVWLDNVRLTFIWPDIFHSKKLQLFLMHMHARTHTHTHYYYYYYTYTHIYNVHAYTLNKTSGYLKSSQLKLAHNILHNDIVHIRYMNIFTVHAQTITLPFAPWSSIVSLHVLLYYPSCW